MTPDTSSLNRAACADHQIILRPHTAALPVEVGTLEKPASTTGVTGPAVFVAVEGDEKQGIPDDG